MIEKQKIDPGISKAKSFKQSVSSWFRRKRELAKVNSPALIGMTVATTATYAVPYVAQQCGLDRQQAATWVSAASNFALGNLAVLISSSLLNKGSGLMHNLRVMGKSMLAGGLAMIVMWSGSHLAITYGASDEAAETFGLVVNYIAYLSFFNIFNRKRS